MNQFYNPEALFTPALQDKALTTISSRGTLEDCGYLGDDQIPRLVSYLKAKRQIRIDPKNKNRLIPWVNDEQRRQPWNH